MKPIDQDEPPILSFAEAAPQLDVGDTILCRLRIRCWNPHDWMTALIALVAWSRGKRRLPFWRRYVHAAKILRCEGEWILAEVTAGGGRMLSLEQVVKRWPGRLVVFRPLAQHYRRHAAAEQMILASGRPYGWPICILMGAAHLMLLGRVAKKFLSRWGKHLLPDCSMQVAIADLAGGMEACPGRSPAETEPHHLAESKNYRAICVLT